MKRLGVGVVAVTLGLAACGGKYEVGNGDEAAQAGQAGAGTAGTGNDGAGGSSTSGGGVGGSAGASIGGGGAIGGASSGGVAGSVVGGASAGGSSGAASCELPEALFPEYERAAPEVVWDRLSAFLHGESVEPLIPFPETTTNDWIRDAVRVLIDERTLDELGRPPGGLVTFMQDWAFEGNGAESARFWSESFSSPGGTFAALFEPFDGRVSFLSDRAFLVAHPNSTRRGIWMLMNLTCVEVPLPPPDIEIEPVPVPETMTRRQIIEATVSDAVCTACHVMFDPLGFSLENYDELGEYRTTENGLPIDASGTYDQNGLVSTFASIAELAPDIGASCVAAQCFAKKLFEDALTRVRPDLASVHQSELAYVQNRFTERNGEFVYLYEAIATTPSFSSP